jgi:hypothetical protein
MGAGDSIMQVRVNVSLSRPQIYFPPTLSPCFLSCPDRETLLRHPTSHAQACDCSTENEGFRASREQQVVKATTVGAFGPRPVGHIQVCLYLNWVHAAKQLTSNHFTVGLG